MNLLPVHLRFPYPFSAFTFWVGLQQNNPACKKFTISNIHRRPFGVTWCNLWKNTLVKQKLFTESWNLLSELCWNKVRNEFVFHQSTKTYLRIF